MDPTEPSVPWHYADSKGCLSPPAATSGWGSELRMEPNAAFPKMAPPHFTLPRIEAPETECWSGLVE